MSYASPRGSVCRQPPGERGREDYFSPSPCASKDWARGVAWGGAWLARGLRTVKNGYPDVVPSPAVRWPMDLAAFAWAASAAFPGMTGVAHAQDKNACIDADTQGQELRLKGHWRDAEVLFQTCLRLQCPAAVAQDCTARYDDVRSSMPTLLVAAQQPDGTDTVDARLVIDGQVVAPSLSATAFEVDPGEHLVTIQHDGWLAPEERVVVREREKDRRLAFQFAVPSSQALSSREAAGTEQRRGGVDALGLALAVSGGVAVAVGASFAVAGLAKRSSLLADSCSTSKTCSPGDVSTVNRDYWVAGVVGGVGLVALGIGIWELLTNHERPRAQGGLPGVQISF